MSESELIRLNKYLSEVGVCSRREADRLIEEGLLTVDGILATVGCKVTGHEEILLRGKPIQREEKSILLLVNKPKGIICTSSKKEGPNIIDYLNFESRIYPIGRLDKDSRGLLLMTNEGDLVNRIMRAGNFHEKEYLVEVNREITADFINKMRQGVYLAELDETTRPCKVRKLSRTTFSIILTQGLNRQIRRMCETLGYRVRDLKRIRIMNLTLGDLKEGQYREITEEERKCLMELIKDSVSTSQYAK